VPIDWCRFEDAIKGVAGSDHSVRTITGIEIVDASKVLKELTTKDKVRCTLTFQSSLSR